jgi:hypothetical protein
VPTDTGADEVRLRVPAVASMASVVTVAARVLAGRAGLAEADVEQARSEVRDAFAALADAAPGTTVHLVAEVSSGRLVIDLATPSDARRITATR